VEVEDASPYYLRKVCKGSLDKLNVALDGRVGYRHNTPMVKTSDAARIEQETVHFTDSLLNGRQDEHL
jgi:hypothetical protein